MGALAKNFLFKLNRPEGPCNEASDFARRKEHSMAHVKNVKLKVGHAPSGDQFADITYDVDFDRNEVVLDMRFQEVISLIERDEALDVLIPSYGDEFLPGISILVVIRGARDDVVGNIATPPQGVLQPNGLTSVRRAVRVEWRFPNNEDGPEEYRALVIVTPQMWQASGWSDEASANLA
jgi:hypothetical protein